MKTDMKPRDILLSLLLLTRVPLPHLPDSWFSRQAQAVWAFPIVGAGVGAMAALAMVCAQVLNLPAPLSAGLALTVLIVVTGAMHEDGLADTADGFWGGFERARRLEIMKDSHIGTYGVLALILSLGLRWAALTAVLPHFGPWAVVAVAALSRAGMPVLMLSLPNARDTGLAHRVGTPSRRPALVGIALAGLIALALLGTGPAILCLFTCGLGLVGLHYLAQAKIAGRTGDVLGAAQQIGEILCLLTLASLI